MQWWGVAFEELARRLLTVAALHDLGKLNCRWQEAIGNNGGEPLAHSQKGSQRRLPAHATVSGYALEFVWPDRYDLWFPLRLAVHHHHAVGAKEVPGLALVEGWDQEASTALRRAGGGAVSLAQCPARNCDTACSDTTVDFSDEREYVTYALASRALRLSDWTATSAGGHETVLGYEDWSRNA